MYLLEYSYAYDCSFQIPAQLSQEQLQAIRVSYHEEGWVRCLGNDLKFHWMNNKSNTNSEQNTHKYEFLSTFGASWL